MPPEQVPRRAVNQPTVHTQGIPQPQQFPIRPIDRLHRPAILAKRLSGQSKNVPIVILGALVSPSTAIPSNPGISSGAIHGLREAGLGPDDNEL